MTENELRAYVANAAIGYLGATKGSALHKDIIALYNTINPLPRGHRLTVNDAWCAAFVSAIGVKCNLADIFPLECSCNKQIKQMQSKGKWIEDDSFTPNVGDLIYYDWDDNGKGDDKGDAEHVGIVVSVSGSSIKVIEGNKSSKSCAYRTVKVNARYIRGYACPDYASKAEPEPVIEEIKVGDAIRVKLGVKTYYNGKKCPLWVLNSTLYARQKQTKSGKLVWLVSKYKTLPSYTGRFLVDDVIKE